MGLSLGVFTSVGGPPLIDPLPIPIGLEFRTNEHGFAELTCFLPLSLARSFVLYDRPGLPHVVVFWNGLIAYEGRLEDVKIVPGGVQLTAFGYWRALLDNPYTALWSASKFEDWQPVLETTFSTRKPAMYTLDNQARLFIGLSKSSVYANNADVGAYFFQVPDGGGRDIKFVSFDYAYDLPVNWTFGLRAYTAAWGSVQSTDITTTGGAGSGSGSWDLSATPRAIIVFQIFNSSGVSDTYIGEHGARFLRIDKVRVRTTASATVEADEIAIALAADVNGHNPTQLQASSALIQSPGFDLFDELYEDLLPGDILTRLAALGDLATPPQRWEVGVWENRYLHLRPRGSAGRTWAVDVSAPEIERTIESLVNRVQAKYQDAGGGALRTAVASDAASQTRYGLKRGQVLSVSTSDLAQATAYRNVALQDGKDPAPRVGLAVDKIYDARGARWPTFMPRSGDTIVMRNLPVTASVAIDRIRSFRLSETRYDVDTDTIELTPETPLPTLDFLIAREAVGPRPHDLGGMPV